jgi:hypothetical protein
MEIDSPTITLMTATAIIILLFTDILHDLNRHGTSSEIFAQSARAATKDVTGKRFFKDNPRGRSKARRRFPRLQPTPESPRDAEQEK